MTPQIIQTSLTSDMKKHIYSVFAQHAIAATGIDGLAEDPVVFEMREGNRLMACVGVQIFWGQLHIKYLIVEEPYGSFHDRIENSFLLRNFSICSPFAPPWGIKRLR